MTQMQTVAELFRCSHHREKYLRAWAAIMLCSNTVNVLTLVRHEWILLSDKLIFTYKILAKYQYLFSITS